MTTLEPATAERQRIGVIGLGYVGLTEAVEFARVGFSVTGFEINEERVRSVQSGRSYLVDVSSEELGTAVDTGALRATADFAELGGMDAILICVPTPLSKTKAPDLSYIAEAVQAIRRRLRCRQLIVLESTTYPGTTSEVVLPELESTGLRVGRDFHLCFSPERINPGDQTFPPSRIPRVVGGMTPACAERAAQLYRCIASEVVLVSCAQSAEMVKLLENTFRAVNIGLVNELALMCRSFGLDVWEIIDAAASKPFGFIPFYPGPGLGGHCIPIDPLYLSWKARVNGFEPRFIDLAHQVNSAMPHFVITTVIDALNARARSVNGSTILLLGVAYKRDVNDARESPAFEIIGELWRRGATVRYHDPYVPSIRIGGRCLESEPIEDETLRAVDAALILTDHRMVDYKRVAELAPLVIDTRNATAGVVHYRDKIVRL
jgi:UDP-N-acetyl-D-glucosamine dehydrogenase